MQLVLKSTLVVAAACGLAMAVSSPSQAHGVRYVYPTQGYSIYQGPDGSYDSLADFTRDIWGIPCGIECTREAQARWSHYPHRPLYGE
jgi:hypothetical protein